MGRMGDKYIEEMERVEQKDEEGYDEYKRMLEENASALDDKLVKIKDWKDKIHEAKFVAEGGEMGLTYLYPDNNTESLLTEIWMMSMEAFDQPREIQVVIDANDEMFISVGSPSFVSFTDDETQLTGMKLPIKCWIHTHPFGKAYFSGTDWKTINTWRPIMKAAIVLGDNQYISYDCDTEICKHVFYGIYKQGENENE